LSSRVLQVFKRASLGGLPIKRKLLVIMMGVTSAALLLAGASIVLFDSFLFRNLLQRNLSALAEIIAENSSAALAFENAEDAAQTLATLRRKEHLTAACLFRTDGTVFAVYSRPGAPFECGSPESAGTRSSVDQLVVRRPVSLYNRQLGTIVLYYTLDEIGARRKLYGAAVLSIVVISAAVAFSLSSWLRATIATPVARLADAAAAISKTKDYSVRAEKLSNDELGLLVDAFNEMVSGIQLRDQDLRQALSTREDALRDAHDVRDFLQITLASIGDAVIATDAGGRIVFANPIALTMTGWAGESVIDKNIDEVFRILSEPAGDPMESPVTRVLRDGAFTSFDDRTVLVSRDGTQTLVHDSAAPIRDESGGIRGTVLVFRDATPRRRAEATSRLLASIVESSDDAIISATLEGTVISWNRGAEGIFGYSAAEMIGAPLSIISGPDRLDEMYGILRRIGRGERIEELRTVRRARDGSLVNVSLTVSPILDATGKIIGASKIARDITEQVRAEGRLAQANADLKQSIVELARSNEDLERFTFIASHDLQEPLRMIATYSQLLVREYPRASTSSADRYVEHIVEGTTRMRELLADLLAYARIGAAGEEPLSAVDLNRIVEMVLKNLKASIDETGAMITWDPLPKVMAYEAHFVPLFQNLINNAIKYRSEKPPHIHIDVRESDGELLFSVADNGIGIDPQYHEKIFVAFKRLHGRKIPGTGIGLAICHRVVERYGGRIWVQSRLGEGATFLFTLPAVALATVEQV
jgi:PAS domain S-box-containing protein